MKLMASLFLATYPEANSPKVAANAVALAKQIDAALHAVAINVEIPDVSNALSSLLLDLPNKIHEVEAISRKCGRDLLEVVAKEAAKSGMSLTTQELAAARAIADARPLLAHATTVTILTVTDEKRLPGQDIGERLAQGLRTRGLVAEAVSIQAGSRSIGAALQQHSLKIGGNLLVMGGYGHSRVRDFVLGGATEGILANLQLPVLLSH